MQPARPGGPGISSAVPEYPPFSSPGEPQRPAQPWQQPPPPSAPQGSRPHPGTSSYGPGFGQFLPDSSLPPAQSGIAGVGPNFVPGMVRPGGPPGSFVPSQPPASVNSTFSRPITSPPSTGFRLPSQIPMGVPVGSNFVQQTAFPAPRAGLQGPPVASNFPQAPPPPSSGFVGPPAQGAPLPGAGPLGSGPPGLPGQFGASPGQRQQFYNPSQPRPGAPQLSSQLGVPQPPPPPPTQFGAPQGNVSSQFGSLYAGAPASYTSGQGNFGGGSPPLSQANPSEQQRAGYGPPPIGGYGLDQASKKLVEEFQSLSMVPLPGSLDAGVDPAALPRPLNITDPPSSTWAANCHPRYLRLTCNAMPNSHSLLSRWHLPLGAVAHPLAEAPPGEEVPVVNFGATSIVRCRRCRTYINAYVVFTDGGRRWRCNVCVLLNEVPVEYFCPLDANGKRRDADERPELSKGSIEFIASTEYMVRPPMPPVYFFLIDVSLLAVKTGMLQVACETIKSSLDKLPGFPRTQIGFLTFDSTLHFYSLKSSLTQPQMMVVAELDDPFLPMPDDLLVNLSESRTVVEALLDSLPSMFVNNINVESAFGPALKASFMIMSQLGGKLIVFQSTLPSLGVGRLKLRGDDPRIYGTDKESTIRVTEEAFYKQMAADFSKFQIGVNIYAFSDKYTDLASLGTLVKYTGGQLIHYPGFQFDLHSEKFSYELARDLTRETAWEAVMRIRCGKGIRFHSYHGHLMLRSSDLLALPAVDCDKAYAMQLNLEDTLLTSQTVYFQCAVLYTSSAGERRIRVHTMAAPVTADLGEMYRSADVGAITSIMSRLAIEKSLTSKLEDTRQAMQQRLIRSLREYRNLFAVQHRTSGRLIFPESLKLLPLFTLALCKSIVLRGGFNDASVDERSAAAFEMMTMPATRLLRFLYPSLFRVDDLLIQGKRLGSDAQSELPLSIPLAAEKIDPRGVYVLNDGLRFVLWLGKAVPLDTLGKLVGIHAANAADLSKVAVVEQDSDISKRFMAILQKLRERNPAVYQQCLVLRQGEQPREGILFLSNLVEDRSTPPLGYVDWMIQIHRLVQQNM